MCSLATVFPFSIKGATSSSSSLRSLSRFVGNKVKRASLKSKRANLRTCAYQGIRNVSFPGNLASFVFFVTTVLSFSLFPYYGRIGISFFFKYEVVHHRKNEYFRRSLNTFRTLSAEVTDRLTFRFFFERRYLVFNTVKATLAIAPELGPAFSATLF